VVVLHLRHSSVLLAAHRPAVGDAWVIGDDEGGGRASGRDARLDVDVVELGSSARRHLLGERPQLFGRGIVEDLLCVHRWRGSFDRSGVWVRRGAILPDGGGRKPHRAVCEHAPKLPRRAEEGGLVRSTTDRNFRAGGEISNRVWLGLATIYIVWGSTYLAIAVADRTIPPFCMAAARFLIAGAVLFA